MNRQSFPPEVHLMKFIMGKWISKPLHAVAELGIADLLQDGPMSIKELASITSTHEPFIYRVLRALAGVGVFEEIGDRHFRLTPMGEFLKTGAMRSWAQMAHAHWNDRAWDKLIHGLKTGDTPFEAAHKMNISSYLQKNPQAAALLSEANSAKAKQSHHAIVDAYDFSSTHHLIDIGGGTGALMMEILEANPHMTGVIADLPQIIPHADAAIKSQNLANRCRTQSIDFFQSIPTEGDALLLSHILHDWPDTRCRQILTNCRKAMTPDSKLLIVEILVPPGNTPSVSKLLDLEMLVITGGRERTEQEFIHLLQTTGFHHQKTIPTSQSISILQATPSV
jgi:cyclopropane fatty-acyl-phospholipid synthase-like methyltransferase